MYHHLPITYSIASITGTGVEGGGEGGWVSNRVRILKRQTVTHTRHCQQFYIISIPAVATEPETAAAAAVVAAAGPPAVIAGATVGAVAIAVAPG